VDTYFAAKMADRVSCDICHKVSQTGTGPTFSYWFRSVKNNRSFRYVCSSPKVTSSQ
jgi:hypothetical protein